MLGQFAKSAGYQVTLPRVLIPTEGKVFINIGTRILLVNGDVAVKVKDLKFQEI